MRKERERLHLQRFMSLAGWIGTAEDAEAPDFIVRQPGMSTGVEITELLNLRPRRRRARSRSAARKSASVFYKTLPLSTIAQAASQLR